MMIVAVFAILSAAVSVCYSVMTGFTVIKLICALVLSFIAVNLIYVLVIILICAFPRHSIPIKKQSRCCVLGSQWISCLLNDYFRVRVHCTGLEKLPEGRFLLVSNHNSGFDILVLIEALRGRGIAFVSKLSNMDLPVVGQIGRGMGCLPIDRENNRKALETILTAADYLKRDVCSMVIFPEGTRNHGLEMLPFHAGSFKIAQKAHVPVVVASLRNTDKAVHGALREGTDAYVDILRVIPEDEVSSMNTAGLAELSRNTIIENLNKEN